MGKKPAFIISDEPEKQKPGFGFDGYAQTITDLIAYKKIIQKLETPGSNPLTGN